MRKRLLGFTVALVGLFVIGLLPTARSADMAVNKEARFTPLPPNCQDLWRCGPAGCDWHRVCSRPCPDGYSCAPLYGAYGPYGGVGYWGAYTDSGWDR